MTKVVTLRALKYLKKAAKKGKAIGVSIREDQKYTVIGKASDINHVQVLTIALNSQNCRTFSSVVYVPLTSTNRKNTDSNDSLMLTPEAKHIVCGDFVILK